MKQCEGCQRMFDDDDLIDYADYGYWCNPCLESRLVGPFVKGLADVPNLLRDTPPANLLTPEAVATVLVNLRKVQRWVRSLVRSYEAHFVAQVYEDGEEVSFNDVNGIPVLSVRRGAFKGNWERDYEITYREV